MFAALFSTAGALYAQDTSSETEAAETAAESWIALVDSESYVDSWEAASPAFQTGISQDEWATAVEQVRGQVGTIESRTLLDSQYHTSLPNAPEGEYVVLQYESVFTQLPQAMEMVVLTKADDEWKAAGYQVVPAQQQQNPQGP